MSNVRTDSRSSTYDVLVLEDDEVVRLVTVDMLEDAGFSVCEAANSTEALAIMEMVPCRVLVVDLMLGPDSPIRDGRNVAAEAMHLYPGRAVIYTSGLPVDLGRPLTTRERSLLKPYAPRYLVGAVRELLQAELFEMLAD